MRIIKTPLVLFTFNRSDNLQLQLNAITEFHFEKIYFISDGPRNENDIKGILECRDQIRKINNCNEIIFFENQENWGCKRNFLTHLNTIFNHEDKVIVLEDDCIPLPEFFEFCEWALEYYENHQQVSLISGSNLLDYNFKEKFRCNYSQYINIWGWAGWRNKTWSIINPYLSITNIISLNDKRLRFYELDFFEKLYWKNIFKHSVYSHKIWDFYLQFGFFISDAISVYPAKNLIKNVGFGNNATHTKKIPDYVLKSLPHPDDSKFLLLEPPVKIQRNQVRDKQVLKKIWGYSKFNLFKLYLMNIVRYANI